MFFSQIELTTSQIADIIINLYYGHEIVASLFPRELHNNSNRPFLYHVDFSKNRILIYSQQKPNMEYCRYPILDLQTHERNYQPAENQILNFYTRINMVRHRDIDNRKIGLTYIQEQDKWLGEQSEKRGFEILNWNSNGQKFYRGIKTKNKKRFTYFGIDVVGNLRVTDKSRFWNTLQNGIGGGRSFGFGMLLCR